MQVRGVFKDHESRVLYSRIPGKLKRSNNSVLKQPGRQIDRPSSVQSVIHPGKLNGTRQRWNSFCAIMQDGPQ